MGGLGGHQLRGEREPRGHQHLELLPSGSGQQEAGFLALKLHGFSRHIPDHNDLVVFSFYVVFDLHRRAGEMGGPHQALHLAGIDPGYL